MFKKKGDKPTKRWACTNVPAIILSNQQAPKALNRTVLAVWYLVRKLVNAIT